METPFRQWDIVLLQAYAPHVLNVQQFRYLNIINEKGFENHTNDEYTNVYCEGLGLGQRYPNRRDVRILRCGNNSRLQLSGDAVGYYGRKICSYLNLVDIATEIFTICTSFSQVA